MPSRANLCCPVGKVIAGGTGAHDAPFSFAYRKKLPRDLWIHQDYSACAASMLTLAINVAGSTGLHM